MNRPRILVVGGVSGSGKTTVGRRLAARWGAEFLEGDDLHSPENVAKMKAGVALTDADRAPWLRAIGERIDAWRAKGAAGVVACSALKRAYRDVLRRERPEVWIALLDAPAERIARRLELRKGHFMPASLLASQIATREPIGVDEERAFEIAAEASPDATAAAIEERLRQADR